MRRQSDGKRFLMTLPPLTSKWITLEAADGTERVKVLPTTDEYKFGREEHFVDVNGDRYFMEMES